MGIYVFLHDSYADWELGYILPELVQHERKPVTFGLRKTPVGSLGGLTVTPTLSLDEIDVASVQALILPGGLSWKDFESTALDELVRQLNARRVPVAGICAATGYLARLGLLDSVAHTSNSVAFLKERAPGYSGAARYQNKMSVSDGGIITAGGLGAVDFTYDLLRALNIGDTVYQETWYRAFKHGEEPRDSGKLEQATSWSNVINLETLTFEDD
ncbi:MAG: DJ-1/PfpI family protein, partial [Deltaproteobacteria bacterium]|nr:DJ-1/PfpI family protein [Deltaproteobacteria bacterium]